MDKTQPVYVSVGLDKAGNIVEVRDRHGRVREPEQCHDGRGPKIGEKMPNGKRVSRLESVEVVIVTTEGDKKEDDEDGLDPCWVCSPVTGRCYRIC